MQHNIKPEEHGPRGQAMTEPIQNCVHCGFCLAACPTYQVLEEEMDSPRGRIYLMKGVLEGEFSAEQAQPFIDRCLGCMACVPACPSGVAYGDLLTSYRARMEQTRTRPLLDETARTLIKETLPYPDRFRLAAASGRLVRGLRGLLPDQLGAMLGMLPDHLPPAQPLQPVYKPRGKARARVALLSGCVQQVLAPQINRATVEVLLANGVEVLVPQGQGCCGSILMHIGEDAAAIRLAEKNLSAFPTDVDAVITNAAGCGSGMKEYELLFAGQPRQGEAHAFADRVEDISVFLDQLGLTPPGALPEPLTVAYQDACHLLNAQGISAAPRKLLRAVPNLTLAEIGDGALCCGSAGTYNLEQPEIAAELGRRKAQHILETGAHLVVSGNIGCLNQIGTQLRQMDKPLPVMHTIELLACAYRGESPV